MRNVLMALRPLRTGPHLKRVPTIKADQAIALDATSGIDASQAGAAVGLDPAKTQLALWHEKTQPSSAPPEPLSRADTSAHYWNTLLEPLVASVYTKRSGYALRRVNRLACHPAHPWMQAKVDWEVLGCPDVALMRYISVGKHASRTWERGLPAHERINAMHLLAVTGQQAVDLAVLVCGQQLQIHRVGRHEPLIEQLMLRERHFWRHVELNEPPPSDGAGAPWHAGTGGGHGPS